MDPPPAGLRYVKEAAYCRRGCSFSYHAFFMWAVMPLQPSSAPLRQILRDVPRRYRLPCLPPALPEPCDAGAGAVLALAIEQARTMLASGRTPDGALQAAFVGALARLIREAMREDGGDPVYQAMVLRHRIPHVREYASLTAHARQDGRQARALANAIAHPGKQERTPPGPVRDALSHLYALASSSSWGQLRAAARRLLETRVFAGDASMERGVRRLAESPALIRLDRLDTLACDEYVLRYQALWDMNGPRPGSTAAAANGSVSQWRGAAVETMATRALQALAARLNQFEGELGNGMTRSPVSRAIHAGKEAPYRVVTSMRVPASISAGADRAKTEWDVVLLRRRDAGQGGAAADKVPGVIAGKAMEAVWDVCLLVEAKASLDAATTDLQRLLRGLQVLADAPDDDVHVFQAREGPVRLGSVSLRNLSIEEQALRATVLYCTDAPAEASPRLLGAASRMQLLSAPASLDFARGLAENRDGAAADLQPVWQELLHAPRWHAVLHQYPMLRQVRELLVNIDDLAAAIELL